VIDSTRAIRPWPWTLNVAGQGHFYATRKAAADALALVLASGRESADIGLMILVHALVTNNDVIKQDFML